jgi:uncharacterized protein involved in type VI secretion and phage assembly
MDQLMVFDELSTELLEWVKGHYFGKYRGTVSDNDDPESRGRIKVKVPAVLSAVEAWAMPCVPYAGDGVGFYSLPAVGTGVWVEFEAGDPSFPIWTGCFWADNELPDRGGAGIKIWKTEKVMIRIDDGGDVLKLENSSGSTLTIASEIQSESGGGKHTVGSRGVVSELGLGKVEVMPAVVIVNNGSIEVV